MKRKFAEGGTECPLTVPLVHEVIPILEAMEHDLAKVRDSRELPNVIRIAAIAGLLVVSKYYALTDDNEVYCIAIGTSRVSLVFCNSIDIASSHVP